MWIMLCELYDVNCAMLRMQISFWSLPTSDQTIAAACAMDAIICICIVYLHCELY